MSYYIEMITAVSTEIQNTVELFSNHQKSPFTSDLMSNAAGTCSRTWDRIGPKVTSLHTSISPEFSKNQFG